MLLEQQVIGKDPISDWFCLERYNRPNLMASRTGWQPQGQGTPPDISATRRFLAVQIPAIHTLLPLLDAGLVVLVPSEVFQDENRRAIADLAQAVRDAILTDPTSLAQQFQPEDLPVDDDVRGLFVLAGGDVSHQTMKHLQRAIDYFAAEYVLSDVTQSTYTSVFEWESYLLREGVSEVLSPTTPTTQVMLSTRIPALSGLSPKVIRSIHDDEAIGEFRAELVNIYGNCPLGPQPEVEAYAQDREKTLLEPKLKRLSEELDRGPLSRLGIRASRVSFSLVGGLAVAGIGAVATGPMGAAAGLLPVAGALLDEAKKTQPGTTKIWSSLVRHGQTPQDEIPRATASSGDMTASAPGNPWGIKAEAGSYVRVTAGTILHWNAVRPEGPVSGGNHHRGPYAPCTCGSALKYKFCCAGTTPAP